MESKPSVILLYHRFGSPLNRSTVSGQYVMAGLLRAQLRSMFARGYRPASLTQLVTDPAYARGYFTVTIDDGYTSVGEIAWPILRELQVPTTLFVVVDGIGGTNSWDQREGDIEVPMLSESELRRLAGEGMAMGAHTLAHPRLTQLDDAALQREVVESGARLAQLLGTPVTTFSYPYGNWDTRVRQAVIDAGYTLATATKLKDATPWPQRPAGDPFSALRVNIRWNTIPFALHNKIARAYAKEGR